MTLPKNLYAGELGKAVKCPACDQVVKTYPRQIYKANARALISMYRFNMANPGRYFRYKDLDIDIGGSDLSKLRFWDLIERKPHIEDDKKFSGYWRITELGISFCLGRATVKRYCHVYNNTACKFSGEDRSIHDALKDSKFSYAELMGMLL